MKKVVLSLIVCIPLMLSGQNKDTRGYIVNVGDPSPDFDLVLQDGSKTSLNELKGKVIMLQFTASWCGVCRKEMPHIEKDIWLPYKDKGLVLIGIDRGEPIETVKAFAEKMKITYPLALDEDESIFRKFAEPKAGVTRNILIDKNGKIVYLTRLFNMEEFNGLKKKIAEEMKN